MQNREKTNVVKLLFVFYCVLVVWTVLFKLSFSLDEIYGIRRLNLIPFYYVFVPKFYLGEMIENVLIFIPFGIYMKILGAKDKTAVISGFCFSLALELCQYIFSLGTCDVTDVMANTAGSALGVLIFILISRKIKNGGLSDKINKTAAYLMTAAFLSAICFVLALRK